MSYYTNLLVLWIFEYVPFTFRQLVFREITSDIDAEICDMHDDWRGWGIYIIEASL